jgi:hypothetical protein
MRGFWGGALAVVLLLLLVAAVHRTTDTYLFEGGIRVGHIDYLFGGSTTDTSVTIGSSGMTKLTVTTADTGNAEVLVPDNSIALGSEVSGFAEPVTFCGQLPNATTGYLGPGVAGLDGTPTDYVMGGTACDALDSGTEATADAPISTLAVKVVGMRCKQSAASGASETTAYTLRTATADAVTTDGNATAITCNIDGASATECRSVAGSTTNIAAGATMAVKVVASANLSAQDARCQVLVAWP